MAKRYHRGNQKPYIEGQIIQWPKDTKGVTLWYLLAIVLSVLQYTVSGYPYGIFWPLYYLSFNLRFLVTPLVSFGHCIICYQRGNQKPYIEGQIIQWPKDTIEVTRNRILKDR
jgi:hypothetical protein